MHVRKHKNGQFTITCNSRELSVIADAFNGRASLAWALLRRDLVCMNTPTDEWGTKYEENKTVIGAVTCVKLDEINRYPGKTTDTCTIDVLGTLAEY